MTKDDLIALARENDVKIDTTQKKAEIAQVLIDAGYLEAIDDDEGPKTTPLLLIRDAWDHNGDRQPAGSVADFEIQTAKDLIKAGAAERADPLPGDE